jgi:alpha-N-arabinofuranosidase
VKAVPKLLLFALYLFMAAPSRAGAQDMVIYHDGLRSGWLNYGWATLDYANQNPVHSGTSSISVSDTSGRNRALYLAHPQFDSTPYESLFFWIYPTASGSNQLQVRVLLSGKAQAAHPLSFSQDQVGKWQSVTIPLSDLGVAGNPDFSGVWIQNATAKPVQFDVDDIGLIAVPPPDPVPLTVDAGKVIRTVDPRMYGINLAIWDRMLGQPITADILATLGEGAVRFPGGSGSDVYDWHAGRNPGRRGGRWPTDVTTFARVTEAQKAQPFITLNYGSGTPQEAAAWVAYYNDDPRSAVPLGVDARNVNWQTAGYWASLRGAAPQPKDDGLNSLRMSHQAPFGFKDWEVGNECYGGWENDLHGAPGSGLTGAPHDPYTYAQAFAGFYKQMLAVDPTIHVGAVIVTPETGYGDPSHSVPSPEKGGAPVTGWTPVVLSTLKSLGVTPHFLIYHSYAQNPGHENDAMLLQAGARLQSDAREVRRMAVDYLGAPGKTIELDLTELNSVSANPGKQSTSLVNGLFMADALGNVAQTEFNACTWWDMRNGTTNANNSPELYGRRQFGDYGLVSSGGPGIAPNTPYPTYYAAKLLTHWARGGDAIVTATSSYPLLSIHAARLAKGQLALMIVNKHPTVDLHARIALSGFAPAPGNAVIYSYGKQNDLQNTDLTTGTVAVSGTTIDLAVPSYSMNVLVLNPSP